MISHSYPILAHSLPRAQDTHMKTAVGLSLAKAAYAANAVCAEAVAAAAEWHAPGAATAVKR